MNGQRQTPAIFSQRFLEALQRLVDHHHVIYPTIPPKGRYFEALVEKAFKTIRQPFTWVKPTTPNAPREDLIVGEIRLSLKTETGLGTKPNLIVISKLLTTEKYPWTAESLIRRTLQHLSRYDYILMLRAIWEGPVIHYQLINIPVDLLRLIEGSNLLPVGKLTERQSLGADVFRGERKVLHVHFDGSDGKCQISRLAVSDCEMLLTWDIQISD
jgi:hypothetical protein